MSTPSTPLAAHILRQAREAILAKNYGLARMLLNTLPRDPRAQKWLAQLDEIAPDTADVASDRPTFSRMLGEPEPLRPSAAPPAPDPDAPPRRVNAATLTYAAAAFVCVITLWAAILEIARSGLSWAALSTFALGLMVVLGLLIGAAILQYLGALHEQQKRTNDLLTRIERHLR